MFSWQSIGPLRMWSGCPARCLDRALMLAVLGRALLSGIALAAPTPWSQVTVPAAGAPKAIGGPSNGCLLGASLLEASGPGFVSIRRHRERYFSHPETLDFVRWLGRSVAERSNQMVMVGDLSQPRGGRMDSMHRSHQNGMDVDVWFTLTRSPEQAWQQTPEATDPPSMVASDGRSLSAAWGTEQRDLLHAAATHPDVDRIFVNPAIKQALCEQESDRSWLRKLRPWWGHDAHFHVRLRCPAGSDQCKPQSPVPAGSGCDSSLAWWFSAEARSPKKSSSVKRAPPVPPPACQQVLNAPAQ
ncbi:murein endopeptidase [Thiorhodovibrio frisius]|uniref:Murein endopeptidase n=2 Tax=Thiorhodovibrio frisius TaxID=631362 RepID=H8YVL0_9GAMM|nr:murein endopeptidase [Thiorhodovibrio frisius]WPL23023.1 Penicillin-insensitive murein endopeptidase precursor [Thiorhodovibrio frisius]